MRISFSITDDFKFVVLEKQHDQEGNEKYVNISIDLKEDSAVRKISNFFNLSYQKNCDMFFEKIQILDSVISKIPDYLATLKKADN